MAKKYNRIDEKLSNDSTFISGCSKKDLHFFLFNHRHCLVM